MMRFHAPCRGTSIRLLLALLAILATGLQALGQSGEPWRLPSPQNYRRPARSPDQPLRQPTTAPLPGEAEGLFDPAPALGDDPAHWWSPYSWIRPVDWDGGVELGLSGTAGNSESMSLRAGANMKWKSELHEITWDLTYAKTNSDGVETQNFGILNAGYEHFLGDSPWTYFGKFRLTYDEFLAFDVRIVLNSGVGYQFIKTDALSWKGRLGAGASHEIGGPDDTWVPEALFGTDVDWQFSDRQKLTSKLDYFPAWENFGDYRVYSDIAWEILLNEAYDLNLKLSIINQYDSTPNGRKPNDVNYALLLLWKL